LAAAVGDPEDKDVRRMPCLRICGSGCSCSSGQAGLNGGGVCVQQEELTHEDMQEGAREAAKKTKKKIVIDKDEL
jgi:hypothetical protein